MQNTTHDLALNHALWSMVNKKSTENNPHEQMLSAIVTSFSTWFDMMLHDYRGWVTLELMQNTSLSNAGVAPVLPMSLRSFHSTTWITFLVRKNCHLTKLTLSQFGFPRECCSEHYLFMLMLVYKTNEFIGL